MGDHVDDQAADRVTDQDHRTCDRTVLDERYEVGDDVLNVSLTDHVASAQTGAVVDARSGKARDRPLDLGPDLRGVVVARVHHDRWAPAPVQLR